MKDKVLLVDDEANVLAGYKRQLRKLFSIETAQSGAEGLEAIESKGPFAVIVSDLRMPGMDGIEFLAQARVATPDSARIMLTGFADVQNAIDAVNEGNIFRFLTKPCEPVVLAKAIAAGVKQYRLVIAERELLEQTLRGSVKVLTDILSLLNPEAFGRASRVTHYVTEIVRLLGEDQVWQYETAAMLSQIGCVTLPVHVVRKVVKGRPLSSEETKIYAKHPEIAAELVSNIPRLDEISEMIAYQEKRFDGSGPPEDDRRQEGIPLGARILKVVLDFDALVFSGDSKGRALVKLKERAGWYDPAVLTALEMALGVEAKYETLDVGVYGLKEGMILAEDVVGGEKKLLAKGQELSGTIIKYIRNYHRAVGVDEPIKVIVPL